METLRHGNPKKFGIFRAIKNSNDAYDLAMAAGADKANRRMTSAGRRIWNRADYRIAATEFKRVYQLLTKAL